MAGGALPHVADRLRMFYLGRRPGSGSPSGPAPAARRPRPRPARRLARRGRHSVVDRAGWGALDGGHG
ncbi:hypothetical protein SSBG_06074 [Streptomyces sp. SPB074]|nr:hypothetical protein SSBG_06074 [Streptomyces sp. SPB074]